jgi:hypothetical protein
MAAMDFWERERSIDTRVGQLFEFINNYRFHVFLKRIQNHRTVNLGYFKSLKEWTVIHERTHSK